MIRFSCNRTSEDMTPVIRDVEIAKFAEKVLWDYRPELIDPARSFDDPYYEPALLDPHDFAEHYLGACIEIHDIYTEEKGDVIAGAAVFNRQKVKLFDRENLCAREITVDPNTILLDTETISGCSRGFENFTIMHEAGHLMMHQMVYRNKLSTEGNAALCMRSNIGRNSGNLISGEDFREHQANTFAASMLMPPRIFIPYVHRLMEGGFTRCDDDLIVSWTVNDGSSNYWKYRMIVAAAARKFGVSSRAAEVQMTKYGLHSRPGDSEVREARRRLKMYQSLWGYRS